MRLKTPRDIGAVIRQRRREIGLDQASLARQVGVSRQWIIEAEAGKPGAELGLVLRTLDVLGVRLVEEASTRGARGRKRAIEPPPDIDAIVSAARKPRT
jgi:HTH-type transcriptional regulator/antitoxin HipB